MTLLQAIDEFISALELSESERDQASRQHTHLRDGLSSPLGLDPQHGTFLTGSYARNTAIRPLDDIDVFCVLARAGEISPYVLTPHAALKLVKDALDSQYPGKAADPQNRSVNIAFTGTGIAYDVVPAFKDLDAPAEVFLIPDIDAGAWIASNPKVHKACSVVANDATRGELKPLIKAVKHWNRRLDDGDRLRSFHLEVMAWEILTTPIASRLQGLIALFDGLAKRVSTPTPDPAGLGPDIDAGLSSAQRLAAAAKFEETASELRQAESMARDGDVEGAHHILHRLFGDAYPEKGRAARAPAPSPAPAIVIPRAPDGDKSRFG